MTKENAKRLYEHYVAIGYKDAAEDMLNKHPDLAKSSKPKEVKEEVKDGKK